MTKKMLVAFDKSNPIATTSDFLAPVWEGEEPVFFGLDSGRRHMYGRVVYTGQQIESYDVFAKMVDSGRKIPDVDQTLIELEAYLAMVKDQRLDSVVTIRRDSDSGVGFVLEKTALKARSG